MTTTQQHRLTYDAGELDFDRRVDEAQPEGDPGIGMQRIAGLDISLTASGIGIITRRVDGTCTAATTVITSRGTRADTLTDRNVRLIEIRNELVHATGTSTLVVIEGPSFGSKGASPLDRYGLWWLTVTALLGVGVPVATCPPSTRARYATGAGTSSKAGVALAMARLWPQWRASSDRTADDEADALTLSHAGAVWSGWDVPTLQRHRDVLPAIAWPSRPSELPSEVAVR